MSTAAQNWEALAPYPREFAGGSLISVWPGSGSGNCGTPCERRHREKASRLADVELLDEDCLDDLDDPTSATPGRVEPGEHAVPSKATVTSRVARLPMSRMGLATFVLIPASVAGRGRWHIPLWREGVSLFQRRRLSRTASVADGQAQSPRYPGGCSAVTSEGSRCWLWVHHGVPSRTAGNVVPRRFEAKAPLGVEAGVGSGRYAVRAHPLSEVPQPRNTRGSRIGIPGALTGGKQMPTGADGRPELSAADPKRSAPDRSEEMSVWPGSDRTAAAHRASACVRKRRARCPNSSYSTTTAPTAATTRCRPPREKWNRRWPPPGAQALGLASFDGQELLYQALWTVAGQQALVGELFE